MVLCQITKFVLKKKKKMIPINLLCNDISTFDYWFNGSLLDSWGLLEAWKKTNIKYQQGKDFLYQRPPKMYQNWQLQHSCCTEN